MCGIAGILARTQPLEAGADAEALKRMAESLRQRGPDDSGEWFDPECGVALGFRRLAVLDLTPAGHQPMTSADGRFVIVFNGEIYNHPQLRRELSQSGHSFRSRSDTEVLLAAFCQWGVAEAIRRFNGMFALAVWDRRERLLQLGRDRVGIKPLYYGWAGDVFLFGSELKALRAYPGFHPEVDPEALALYLNYSYIPSPYSIYAGVRKLPPATLLTLSGQQPQEFPEPQPYWSIREAVDAGLAEPFTGSDEAAADELDAVLRTSVRERMLADVPLGIFLSGGVDSSTLTALAQAQSDRPVKTFTLGFREPEYDEAGYAGAIARHLGTEHTELIVTAHEAQAVVPRLATIYDEPFADSSQVPTWLVSELARQQVTVSLSGDGGDELFGGYNRYIWVEKIWRMVGWIPPGLRRLGAVLLQQPQPAVWQAFLASELLPSRWRLAEAGDKIRKLAAILPSEGPEVIYARLVSNGLSGSKAVHAAPLSPVSQGLAIREQMMLTDFLTYLPDNLLVKVDRASMSVSLEARLPYLDDWRVIEFAWRLPRSLKVRQGRGKWLLRRVLSRYVPEKLFDRPKKGFSLPIGAWLRGALRDWAEALIEPGRIDREGFLESGLVRRTWQEHLSGQRDWQAALWNVLMFQAWLEANG